MKLHETRHWRCPPAVLGQRVLVHAAQKRLPVDAIDEELADLCARQFGGQWRDDLPYGQGLGTIRIVDCKPTDTLSPSSEDYLCGDWSPGRFAWEGSAPRLLEAPVPMKGRQGWWTVNPAEVGL